MGVEEENSIKNGVNREESDKGRDEGDRQSEGISRDEDENKGVIVVVEEKSEEVCPLAIQISNQMEFSNMEKKYIDEEGIEENIRRISIEGDL